MTPVNYMEWRISRWETPASTFESARRESLHDAEELVIVLQEGGVLRRRVQFTFTAERLYRNINESYLTGLWAVRPPGLGATWRVENSDFWNSLTSDALAAVLLRGRKEYVFLTEDDIIHVVSATDPRIEELAPADPSSRLPGLSDIYFKP